MKTDSSPLTQGSFNPESHAPRSLLPGHIPSYYRFNLVIYMGVTG